MKQYNKYKKKSTKKCLKFYWSIKVHNASPPWQYGAICTHNRAVIIAIRWNVIIKKQEFHYFYNDHDVMLVNTAI